MLGKAGRHLASLPTALLIQLGVCVGVWAVVSACPTPASSILCRIWENFTHLVLYPWVLTAQERLWHHLTVSETNTCP